MSIHWIVSIVCASLGFRCNVLIEFYYCCCIIIWSLPLNWFSSFHMKLGNKRISFSLQCGRWHWFHFVTPPLWFIYIFCFFFSFVSLKPVIPPCETFMLLPWSWWFCFLVLWVSFSFSFIFLLQINSRLGSSYFLFSDQKTSGSPPLRMPPDIRADPDSFNSHSVNLFDDALTYTRNCGDSKKDSSVQFGNNVTLPKLRLPSLHTGSEIFFSVLFSTFLCIIFVL